MTRYYPEHEQEEKCIVSIYKISMMKDKFNNVNMKRIMRWYYDVKIKLVF